MSNRASLPPEPVPPHRADDRGPLAASPETERTKAEADASKTSTALEDYPDDTRDRSYAEHWGIND